MKVRKGVFFTLLVCLSMMGTFSLYNSALASNTKILPATNVGKEFTVDLDANYTTGYSWKLVTPDEHVKFIKQEFEYKGREGEVGAGGVDHWHFRATAPGTAKLVFEYGRPWEKTSKYCLTVFIPINP